MRNRLLLATLAGVCLLVGWLAGGADGTAAQTEPQPPAAVPDCHYELYGPPESWIYQGGEFSGPVILLNQCTGDTWQLTGTIRQGSWRPIGVGR